MKLDGMKIAKIVSDLIRAIPSGIGQVSPPALSSPYSRSRHTLGRERPAAAAAKLFSFPADVRLEVSIRIVALPGKSDAPEDMVYLLQCFAPHPLDIPAIARGNIGRSDRLGATGGNVIDPRLSRATT